MKINANVEKDKIEIIRAYTDILKLFGEGNKRIINALNNRISNITTYPFDYEGNGISGREPGKTGYENGINSKINVRVRGYEHSHISDAQIEHYIRHEIVHAFAASAYDAFGNHKVVGYNGVIPYYNNTVINGKVCQAVDGSIYEKSINGTSDNKIYGGGYCESMTDIFAICSKVAFDDNFRKRGITVDTVLKKRILDWNINNIITGYFSSIPLSRLTIAAFSNFPNVNYQYILDNGGSIFSTTTTDKGAVVKINDFLYGIMNDPIYIAKEFDKISGEGKYFEFCSYVDMCVNNQAPQQVIVGIINILTKFVIQNTNAKVKNGTYTRGWGDKIIEEFESIKNDVLKDYGMPELESSKKR